VVLDESFEFPVKPKNFEDHLFSERFACPNCNLTLPEIEPRLFSFNTPHGACPVCNGIGSLLKIDEDLVLNRNLSISEGGILPFNRMLENSGWFFNLISAVAQFHNFSIRVPIKDMKREDLEKILKGTGKQNYKVAGVGTNGRGYLVEHAYEGVIPNLERRFRETKSDFMRGEIQRYMRKERCLECEGKRLKPEALAVVVDHKNIHDISDMAIKNCYAWMNSLKSPVLSAKEIQISDPILKELSARLGFLLSVGLDYLSLSRSAETLAGGESQRIRLASQIGSGLSGVLYVLDEPSIGLHQRDNLKLISTLKHLRDLGNTVVVVEHDMEMMQSSDWMVDFGPLAGGAGGEVVAIGTPQELAQNPKSLTGKYLSGKKKIYVTPSYVSEKDEWLILKGANSHNLKNITVKFPLGRLVCVTGVSGSGKSTLVDDTLYHALAKQFNPMHKEQLGAYQSIEGCEQIKRVSMIDQSPIGRTPRSNPATYTKMFDFIREIFAMTAESKIRGYKTGRFSFNVKGGRCEACQGEGQIKIEMQFLPDIYVHCEVCHGTRFNRETLQVKYKGLSIADVLDLTVEEGIKLFGNIPAIANKLHTLEKVGLGYIRIGQPGTTLSGGEAQRVKLSKELSRRATGRTMYVLDEPSVGLHAADVHMLIDVLQHLVDSGNSVLIIEHNLDIIKVADYLIDLGPEGGDRGGELIATGTPREVCDVPTSYTGQVLKAYLQLHQQDPQ